MRFSKTSTFEWTFIPYPYTRRPQQTGRNSKRLENRLPFERNSISKKDTQKIQLFRCVFCAKNDEGENCQQRKALTSHPIRIAQFHETSFFKSTKNMVKSNVFEQASVGVTNSNYINFLETCCLQNRKKLLHSRKAANDKMSPQKPNLTHPIRALNTKKQRFFAFLKT